jgi:hypothetical protein
LGKFIGVIFIFVGAAAILSLIIGGFSVGSLEFLNIDGGFISYPEFFYDATIPRWLLSISLFILVGIPFLVLLVLGLRILSSNVKQFSKATSLTLLSIWFIALLAIIFTGIEFGTTHANYGKYVEKNTLNITKKDTLVLKIQNDDSIYYQHNLRRTSERHQVAIDNKQLTYSNDIRLDVKKSNTGSAYIVVQKDSYGRNSLRARLNAEKIQYKYAIKDNQLILDAFFLSHLKNIFKEEKIDITVFIPENTPIYFDNSVKNFLSDVKNETDIYDREMVNHHFKMMKAVLKCTDCIEEVEETFN